MLSLQPLISINGNVVDAECVCCGQVFAYDPEDTSNFDDWYMGVVDGCVKELVCADCVANLRAENPSEKFVTFAEADAVKD